MTAKLQRIGECALDQRQPVADILGDAGEQEIWCGCRSCSAQGPRAPPRTHCRGVVENDGWRRHGLCTTFVGLWVWTLIPSHKKPVSANPHSPPYDLQPVAAPSRRALSRCNGGPGAGGDRFRQGMDGEAGKVMGAPAGGIEVGEIGDADGNFDPIGDWLDQHQAD